MLTSRKKGLQNFFLLLFSLLLSLGFAEVAVRYLQLAPETYLVSHNIFQLSKNSDLGYELKPNSSWTYEGISYDINFQGHRGPVYDFKKPKKTFRIALIGDSITFGLWVPYQESYAYKLEQLLNSNSNTDYNYEVINFGVSGYTSENLSASIFQANDYNPDLIIYGYCMNDPQEYSGEFEKLKRLNGVEETSFRKFSQLLFKSDLFKAIYFNFFYDSVKTQESANKLSWLDNPQFEAMENNTELLYLQNIHQGEGLERLKTASKMMATFKNKLLVLVFPSFPVAATPADYQFGTVHDAIYDNFKELNIDTLDLLSAYQKSAYQKNAESVDSLHQDKIHPNSAGHTVAATSIYAYLKDNFELP